MLPRLFFFKADFEGITGDTVVVSFPQGIIRRANEPGRARPVGSVYGCTVSNVYRAKARNVLCVMYHVSRGGRRFCRCGPEVRLDLACAEASPPTRYVLGLSTA